MDERSVKVDRETDQREALAQIKNFNLYMPKLLEGMMKTEVYVAHLSGFPSINQPFTMKVFFAIL